MRTQLLSLLCALALGIFTTACGGGRTAAVRPNGDGSTAVQASPPASQSTTQQRSTLRLTLPPLARLQPGTEFDVVLSADTAEPLFQASARLLFDPAQVQPVSTARGAQLPADSVFLARADATLPVAAAQSAALTGLDATPNTAAHCAATTLRALPFAFTGLPGQGGLAAGKLELLRVRFRTLAPLSGAGGIHLLNDPRYLQLRSSDGRRLAFDLTQSEGTK